VTSDSAATASAPTLATATASGDVVRYRCTACGNLTRFNVVTTRRTSAFHHFSVGGELTIEDEEVLDETVEEVTCRWCGNGKGVEVLESDPA
jgi:DNA-directed RNA polymerase subunit M/transcription elongation factor TFIIS